MNFLNKIGRALGITKAPAKEEKAPIKEERMPTGGSRWTAPTTNTPEKKRKKKLNKLANRARNAQHSLAA